VLAVRGAAFPTQNSLIRPPNEFFREQIRNGGCFQAHRSITP
jgi:hypothetical protein